MLSQAKHFFESSDTTSRVVQAEADLLVDVVAVLTSDGMYFLKYLVIITFNQQRK
jgi:hypothetical protein